MKELVIVGGGPVGLSAGIFAALQGIDATILEQQPDIIDKACGEGLTSGGVKLLDQLGVSIAVKRPFLGIRYRDGKQSADGHFHDGPGWGIRRTVLHEALRHRAISLGVNILQHKVTSLQQNDDYVSIDGIKAQYVIGADGLNSTVRKLLNLTPRPERLMRYGVRQHFYVKPWSNYVEVHWCPWAEAYVTPVSDEVVGIALLFGDSFRKHVGSGNGTFHHRALKSFPSLQEHLPDSCRVASQSKGAGPFKITLDKHVVGRVFLVGDAAGYLDPLTGEGVRLGFVTAMSAVNAILANAPESYESQWSAITQRYRWATNSILHLRQIEFLRKLMIPTLRTCPWLFDQILMFLESGDASSPLWDLATVK